MELVRLMGEMMASLVLAAHGSLKNPDSSAPCHAHADALRATGLFERVAVAFWKEEPSLSRALAVIDSAQTYVVPFFMSEGYFSKVIVPRELNAHGPWPTAQIMCGVVGTHPRITEVILERAKAALGERPTESAALVIVGHGTPRHARSSASIHDQVDIIHKSGLFSEVTAAFLDEAPEVPEVFRQTRARNVVVVPMFTADGYHTREQIPALLGIAPEGVSSPLPLYGENAGRHVWCTQAIGRAPGMRDIILARVREQTDNILISKEKIQPRTPLGCAPLREAMVNRGCLKWGQIQMRRVDQGVELHHIADHPEAELEPLADVPALRRWSRHDAQGAYRKLPTAPTLRSGWRLGPVDDVEALDALEAVYPGRFAELHRLRVSGTSAIRSLAEVAQRHTGELKQIQNAPAPAIAAVIAQVCGGCMCARLWTQGQDSPGAEPAVSVETLTNAPALACLEPCPELLNRAAQQEVRS